MNNDSQSPKSSTKSISKGDNKLRKQISSIGANPGGLRLTSMPSQSVSGGLPPAPANDPVGSWSEVYRVNGMLEDTITDLDKKLNRVLAKQEYEYLKGYNIYVKQKEKDLRDLIEKLNEKNSNNTLKDEKISKLESTISAIREDQIRQEKDKEKLHDQIKYWKTKA